MGSEYKIAESADKKVELLLAEMSNRFDLVVNVPATRAHDGQYEIMSGLTPEQIVEIGFKFLQIAAYWAGGCEMRDLIDKKRADIYFHAEGI